MLAELKSSEHIRCPECGTRIFVRLRDSHARSLLKAISWRITGSMDTFVLGLLFTRNVTVAGSIAIAEMATKMVLFYFHERAWLAIGRNRKGQTEHHSN
jgi:uncharacterized membrane protein